MQRSAMRAVLRATNGAQQRNASYKQRFTAVTRGLGVKKENAIGMGVWSGECDSSGLMKLWPVQKLNKTDAERRVASFASIAAKGFPIESGLGQARALIQLGEYKAARAAIPATTTSNGAIHNVAISTRLVIAVNELTQLKSVQEIDDRMQEGDENVLVTEITSLFNELLALVPEDWEAAGAYGEFLLSRNDPAAIPALERAAHLSSCEASSRRGANEVYLSKNDSVAALSDYVDYKYQNSFRNQELAAILEPITVREEPAMERLLTEKYPGLTPAELLSLLPFQVRVSSSALGLIDFLQEPAQVNVKNWTSGKALEAASLIAKYTGDTMSGLNVHNTLTLEEELAKIESSVDRGIDSVLETQKRVSVALTDGHRDRITVNLGKAHSANGDHAAAIAVLNKVIGDNTYVRMYDAFMARGEVYLFFVARNDCACLHFSLSAPRGSITHSAVARG